MSDVVCSTISMRRSALYVCMRELEFIGEWTDAAQPNATVNYNFLGKRYTWLDDHYCLQTKYVTYARLWHYQHAWQPFEWHHSPHSTIFHMYVCPCIWLWVHWQIVEWGRGDGREWTLDTKCIFSPSLSKYKLYNVVYVCVVSWCVPMHSIHLCHHFVCNTTMLFGVNVQNGQMWSARASMVR